MSATTEAQLVGKVQDMSRVLEIVNAADLPFTSMVEKGERPHNSLLEFTVDKYDDARTDGVPDGVDATTFEDGQKDRAQLYARTQKWRRNPMVTEQAEELTAQAATPGSKMAESKAKKIVELKQDMEKTFLSANDSAAESSGTVGSKTRGMGSWTQATEQTDLPVPAAYRPPAASIYSGTIAAFTEDALRALLQSRYETVKSKGDLVAFVGTEIKNNVSDFARYEPTIANFTNVRRFDHSAAGTVECMVDIYKGDFGMVKFMLDLFLPDQYAGHICDMTKVKARMLKNPAFKPLPDLDGGPRGVVSAIGALCNTLPQAHIKIAATAS